MLSLPNAVFVYTLSDILMIFALSLWVLFMFVVFAPGWWRRIRCKHERFHENSACHAICANCQKDLGFIGTVRKERENAP